MASKIRTLLAAAALALGSFGAHATVLDFEGLPTDPNFSVIFTSNYGGLNFGTNVVATSGWAYDDFVTPFYTPHSGKNYAQSVPLTATGDPLEASQSITSATDFVFSGAWFSGLGQIYYDLYNNGVLVHTSATSAALSDSSSLFVDAGYSGFIDEIVVHGQQYFFIMDDVTIPEPSSLALVLLAGAAGVGITRSRRQAAAASAS